ncbi:MAG: Uma2 family endonuclease [Bacteroidota bacterium]
MSDHLILKSRYLEKMTEAEFFQFCQENRDLRIERNHKQEIIIMSPTGSETGMINAEICRQVSNWSINNKRGKTFDSSAGFNLPDGSTRSADVSWVSNAKWAAVSKEDRKKFAPICPEFVVEIKSPSDDMRTLRGKMKRWMLNGTRLGWLINPEKEIVEIYRPGMEAEVMGGFERDLSGEDVLPDFALNLRLLLEE